MQSTTTTNTPGVFSGNLRGSLILITVAGCLAMIYSTAIASPATAEFFRTIGANEFHFGLLGGVPLIMLFLQFPGVLITNRLHRRKPLFIIMVVAARLLYIPVAFLPLLLTPEKRYAVLPVLIGIIALSGALNNLVVPMWFSWIGDLIPRRRLNSYWGRRLVAMQMTWVGSFICIWAFAFFVDWPATRVFPILVLIGVAAGVTDILLFIRVKEPAHQQAQEVHPLRILAAPLRDAQYRRFVVFNCAWSASTMFCAAFMQLYVLKVLQLGLWRTILIWCAQGVGGVLTAQAWGRMADKHGTRPIMVICTCLKSMIVIVFLLVTPRVALIVLSTAFLFDSMLNAGNQIAVNGYMLKLTPRENRSAFIAAITGLAGICGGISALLAGTFLRSTTGFEVTAFGRVWINYHLLFALGILFRWGCILLVRRVREPKSTRSLHVLYGMRGIWPLRFLLFPVGLYRNVEDDENGDEA